ncbi:MAG: class I SAM-dependent methyltransferase [Acidobacteria bacterium]|nr:class I SAM-dependent methyltransferase [Acidobacteriota bacterium]
MRRRLMRFLAAPDDGGELELVVWESRPRPLSDEERATALSLGIAETEIATELEEDIVTGVLLNRRSGVVFPIHHGVPRLLVFPTAVARAFATEHRRRLDTELEGFRLPDGEGVPGEEDVLRSFSAEWLGYEWDGRSYWNLRPEEWFRCMRWTLGVDDHPIRGRRVLEVGIGVGATADHLSRTEGAEVVGVDLSHAVDAAAKSFGDNPFLHVVQASAYALPLEPASFDFVYSFGVLHHTYSTVDGVRSVARMPASGGRLYVWVYSPWDEERTPVRRLLMGLEKATRPVLWRLPGPLQTVAILPLVPLYMGFQALRKLRGGAEGQAYYGFSDALHAARDRFTPRFIHRHTDEELAGWFREAGYGDLEITSQRPKPDFVPEAFTACAGVSGRRLEAVPRAGGEATS